MTSRRCAGCGRALRDPVSVSAGMGPVCRRAVRGPEPLRMHEGVVPAVSGQLELPGCGELPATSPLNHRRVRRRGPTVDLPDIANYPGGLS
ncbi:DUF6011 domain-containing protein [Streptomyces sp. NPDC006784]|uniref:DUF6011 domain-containing protein n=1 Tax=Streptomyces sp. NPDC006784 TaxID=3364764 RepID=UPI0036B91662